MASVPLFTVFCCVWKNFAFLLLNAFWLQKNSQKPVQNEAENIEKSSLKTTCFFTSIFSRLGLDFGGFWGSILEPSWLKIANLTKGTPPLSALKLDVFQECHLGGLQARFWSLQGSILEAPGSILEGFGTPQGRIWRTQALLLACL